MYVFKNKADNKATILAELKLYAIYTSDAQDSFIVAIMKAPSAKVAMRMYLERNKLRSSDLSIWYKKHRNEFTVKELMSASSGFTYSHIEFFME